MINSYNRSQHDALFFKFILIYNSTCFRQTYCPSSGVWTLYSQQSVFVLLAMLTASRKSTEIVWQIPIAVNTVPRLLMTRPWVCLKHVELYIKIKLRKSASCWLLLNECLILCEIILGDHPSFSDDDESIKNSYLIFQQIWYISHSLHQNIIPLVKGRNQMSFA